MEEVLGFTEQAQLCMLLAFLFFLALLLIFAKIFFHDKWSQASPGGEQIALEVVILAEIGPQFLDYEVDLGLSRLTEVRLVADLIRSPRHRVPKVIDDENETAVFGFRDNYPVVLLQQALLEDEVGAARRHDSFGDGRLVHLSDFVRVDSSAVNDDLGLDRKLFGFGVELVNAHTPNDFSIFVLDEAPELNVVSQRGASLPLCKPVNSRCKESVQVHARVVHLGFGHLSAVSVVQGFNFGIFASQGRLAKHGGPRKGHLVAAAHELLQVDQVVAEGARPVPARRPEEGGRGHEQVQFFDEVGRRLQEVVPLAQRVFQQRVTFKGVSLEQAHLLEVANASVCHLRAFT